MTEYQKQIEEVQSGAGTGKSLEEILSNSRLTPEEKQKIIEWYLSEKKEVNEQTKNEIGRFKAITALELENTWDQIEVSKIEKEFYDMALKRESSSIADKISLGYKNIKNIGEDARLQKIANRQILRQALISIIKDNKAQNIDEALDFLKKTDEKTKLHYCKKINPITKEQESVNLDINKVENEWKKYQATVKDIHGDVYNAKYVEKMKNNGNVRLLTEERLRKQGEYSSGQESLYEILGEEMQQAGSLISSEEKDKITKEVKEKDIKGQMQKQLESRREETGKVLAKELTKIKEQLIQEKSTVNDSDKKEIEDIIKKLETKIGNVDGIVSEQIEKSCENYENSVIQDRLQKIAFKKIDKTKFEKEVPDFLGATNFGLDDNQIKTVAYNRLVTNYNAKEDWWRISDEQSEVINKTIFIDGALIAFSGGLANAASKFVSNGLLKLVVEGAVFHTTSSAINTLEHGKDAWNDYLKGVAHSIGMFAVIKGGAIMWNKLGRGLLEAKFGTGIMTEIEGKTIQQLSASGELINYLGALTTEVIAFTSYDISLESLENLYEGKPQSEQFWIDFFAKSKDNLGVILALRIGGVLFKPLIEKALLKSVEAGKITKDKLDGYLKKIGESELSKDNKKENINGKKVAISEKNINKGGENTFSDIEIKDRIKDFENTKNGEILKISVKGGYCEFQMEEGKIKFINTDVGGLERYIGKEVKIRIEESSIGINFGERETALVKVDNIEIKKQNNAEIPNLYQSKFSSEIPENLPKNTTAWINTNGEISYNQAHIEGKFGIKISSENGRNLFDGQELSKHPKAREILDYLKILKSHEVGHRILEFYNIKDITINTGGNNTETFTQEQLCQIFEGQINLSKEELILIDKGLKLNIGSDFTILDKEGNLDSDFIRRFDVKELRLNRNGEERYGEREKEAARVDLGTKLDKKGRFNIQENERYIINLGGGDDIIYITRLNNQFVLTSSKSNLHRTLKDGEHLTIGRSNSDYNFNNTVSKEHLTINITDGMVRIEDNSSKNGTYWKKDLNTFEVSKRTPNVFNSLKQGDTVILELGDPRNIFKITKLTGNNFHIISPNTMTSSTITENMDMNIGEQYKEIFGFSDNIDTFHARIYFNNGTLSVLGNSTKGTRYRIERASDQQSTYDQSNSDSYGNNQQQNRTSEQQRQDNSNDQHQKESSNNRTNSSERKYNYEEVTRMFVKKNASINEGDKILLELGDPNNIIEIIKGSDKNFEIIYPNGEKQMINGDHDFVIGNSKKEYGFNDKVDLEHVQIVFKDGIFGIRGKSLNGARYRVERTWERQKQSDSSKQDQKESGNNRNNYSEQIQKINSMSELKTFLTGIKSIGEMDNLQVLQIIDLAEKGSLGLDFFTQTDKSNRLGSEMTKKIAKLILKRDIVPDNLDAQSIYRKLIVAYHSDINKDKLSAELVKEINNLRDTSKTKKELLDELNKVVKDPYGFLLEKRKLG